ncbi:MAG: L,D-transpeptidase family protein [Akkermansia sp.]
MHKIWMMIVGLMLFSVAFGGVLPADCQQVIMGSSKNWDDSHAQLSLLEKRGNQWVMVKGPFSVRLGKSGLVWGLGLHPVIQGQKVKKEGDLRSPAGVFALGGVYGTVSTPAKHWGLEYRRVTPNDLWVEDYNSPAYNHHLVLNHPATTKWELEQQMKLNDYAHCLKVFIRHNAPGDVGRPIPKAGSSIFFHIWRRDGQSPTAGCTTMSEANLRDLIKWLEPAKKPVYVLLPVTDYLRLRSPWGLP